jgi:hypothetical protein
MFSETTCRSHSQLSYKKSDDGNEFARPSTVGSSDVDAATVDADRISATTSIEIAAPTAVVAERTPPAATPAADIVDISNTERYRQSTPEVTLAHAPDRRQFVGQRQQPHLRDSILLHGRVTET